MCSLTRRRTLSQGWYFDCCCPRCADNTELGTEGSSLACPGQCGGWVVARQPLEADTEWECRGCGARLERHEVEAAVSSFSDRIQRLYEEDRYRAVRQMEDMLCRTRLSSFLFPDVQTHLFHHYLSIPQKEIIFL